MCDRQAVQWADPSAARQIFVRGARLLQRLFGKKSDDRIDFGIETLDLGEVCRHDLLAREVLQTNATGKLRRREKAKFCTGHVGLQEGKRKTYGVTEIKA
jgi:hypothetical protein